MSAWRARGAGHETLRLRSNLVPHALTPLGRRRYDQSMRIEGDRGSSKSRWAEG